ncbi:MAG: EVE domain-containing protein, partial [Candidatus Omnitrophica bacterium]|nr:EVE domain-containing protein [Candidatus Omnitrophota bacterium]
MNQKHWLVIGKKENWLTALQQPIPVWGLRENIYYREFRALSSGDFIWMYVTRPVSGIIGVGIVKDTYIDRENLIWREELETGNVIWPLRFRIQVLKVLPVYDWETSKILINDFSLLWQRGFQQISEDIAMEIFKRSQKVFSEVSLEGLMKGPSIDQVPVVRDTDAEKVPEPVFDSHSLIQNQIAEIGKLQSYHTQLEYPLSLPGERKNIDVIW